jgi:hypothetical protein
MSTYAEIQTDVVAWLNREGFTELIANVPTFIQMALRRVYRAANLNAMETPVSFSTDVDTVPADLLRMKTMTIIQGGGTREVNGGAYKRVAALQGASGCPQSYNIIGTTFRWGPTPDQVYSGEIVYYAPLDALVNDEDTNWLTDNAPELILFGALLEAALYLKDDQRGAVWQSRFDQTLGDLEESERNMDKEPGSLRVLEQQNRNTGSVRNN